ncbi:MAG: cytidylate kinase family protein [Rudaea sp.]
MSVITISRGSFSGGKTLAECLGASLGFRCLDRETVAERAAASGVAQEELLDALLKPPSFLERFKHQRYQYLALFQAALAEEVRTGKVIYHGNAGHLMLKGASPVLKVRVIAPLEKRVAMLQDRLKMGRGEALSYIQKVDRDRKNWTHYLYGVDWEDPSLYDLVINLDALDMNAACEIVSTAARQQKCFAFTGDCQREMEDLAIGSRVRANLAIHPPTSHLEFEVGCRLGRVSIRGKVAGADELEEVKRVAGAVIGVRELDLDSIALPTHV